MMDILHINDWVKLLGCGDQFYFIDKDIKDVVERIKDGDIFFVDDLVSFKDGYGNETFKTIQAFDNNMITVWLSDDYAVAINEICFISEDGDGSEESEILEEE